MILAGVKQSPGLVEHEGGENLVIFGQGSYVDGRNCLRSTASAKACLCRAEALS
jgi:hypothetical protein